MACFVCLQLLGLGRESLVMKEQLSENISPSIPAKQTFNSGSCRGKCQSALGQGSLSSFICIAVRDEAGMVLNGC